MRVPAEITAELSSLARVNAAAQNLESIRVLRAWLESAEAYCSDQLGQQAPSFDAVPVIYGHRERLNTRGATDAAFAGKSTATLRSWLRWWEDPTRSSHGSEEAGRDPQVEAARIRRELDVRSPA